MFAKHSSVLILLTVFILYILIQFAFTDTLIDILSPKQFNLHICNVIKLSVLQQMQQQMHHMHLGGVNSSMPFGGLRSCSSMPQMSQQQGGSAFGGQVQHGAQAGGLLSAPAHNAMASSQPSLTGLDSNFGSWSSSQGNSGQTLSNQLWK